MPLTLRAALVALAAISILALSAVTAGAANVHLRIEGQSKTHFNGDVTSNARSVPGGADSICRANSNPAVFANPNSITAAADALGSEKVTTSGTFFGWGTMLCSVDGEAPATGTAGWLVRINQQDSTAPNGWVTATDPLSNNDKVVLYFSPAYGSFSSSLELTLPAEAKPGEPVGGFVDSFSTATDLKSPGASVTVSGGGATATSAADGSFQLTFPAAGKFLVTAEQAGAIRGSRWVTVNPAAVPAPVLPLTQAQINKQRRVAARAKCRASNKPGNDLTLCIRNANRLARTLTAKQRRVGAREVCVRRYPTRGNSSRIRCVRAANRIGR